MGVFDATNSNVERRFYSFSFLISREYILNRCESMGFHVLFLESVCNDEALIQKNCEMKLNSPGAFSHTPSSQTTDIVPARRRWWTFTTVSRTTRRTTSRWTECATSPTPTSVSSTLASTSSRTTATACWRATWFLSSSIRTWCRGRSGSASTARRTSRPRGFSAATPR